MDHNRAGSDRNRKPLPDGDRLTTPGLTPGTGMRRIEPAQSERPGAKTSQRVGYGLPCAQCGTYYAADVTVCPVCQSGERVSANQVEGITAAESNEAVPGLASLPPVTADGEVIVDEEQLLAERERFLREFKAKLFATHKLNAAVTFHCTLDHNHAHGSEPAAICKSCYDEMEQRADRLDAALRMDLKEAAEIIYEAVWSDPTPGDPGRTYRNAAEALLVELRRRAGMTLVLSPMKPYTH